MNVTKLLLIIPMLATCLTPGNMVRADDCDMARKWYNEGIALSDNTEREASYYQRAIELCPDYFEAHNRLGNVYKNWGEFDLAIKEFRQAGRIWSFAEPHCNLGEVYRMQGRYDLAAEEFINAIRIRPDYREAQNQLKYVYKRLGKYDFVIEAPPELIPTAIFTRIPGMTLPRGSFLVDCQCEYWRQKAGLKGLTVEAPVYFGPASRKVDVYALILGIRYGLTNNLTVGLIPKFFSKKAEVPIPYWGIHAKPGVTGIGDTVLMTKYRLWGRRKTHISGFCLLSIPTGDEDAKGKDQGVIRRIPLGTGSYDFTPGIAFTTVTEPLTITTDISYVITTGRQAGDEFHCDLAFSFPRLHNFIAIMELNYRWMGTAKRRQLFQTAWGFQGPAGPGGPRAPRDPPSQTVFETTVTEKGGHTLFLSPGFQVFLTKGLKAEIGVQVPVVKPEDGWAEGIVLHVGLTKYLF